MIVTCVYVNVKPSAIKSFVDETTVNHFESLKEPGNLRFDILQQASDPCCFLLYEAYETEEAASNHKNTSHYKKWRDEVNDLMAEPRKGVKYNIIEPDNKTKW
jgi:autoinducer 2-degrading protein